MNRILLVEDDHNLGYILSEYLQMHDFDVDWSKNGQDGANVFSQKKYDLCILDVMMPKKDGFTLASEMKSLHPEIPLIFLTAKSLKVDKLKGFKVGCDDYIVKPVDEEELIARIRAVLKRSSFSNTDQSEFQIGIFSFDSSKQILAGVSGKQKLTKKESEILHLLCRAKGDLLETDQILRVLWNGSNYFNRRSMDVFISKLRKYLKDDPNLKISNVHGKGYILEEDT
ncbi:MAG: response regulator transcription factor [Cyclobacteriaceae bacterium]